MEENSDTCLSCNRRGVCEADGEVKILSHCGDSSFEKGAYSLPPLLKGNERAAFYGACRGGGGIRSQVGNDPRVVPELLKRSLNPPPAAAGFPL